MKHLIKTSLDTAKSQSNFALLEDVVGALSLVILLVAALHLPALI